jgi:hypothetical protein
MKGFVEWFLAVAIVVWVIDLLLHIMTKVGAP